MSSREYISRELVDPRAAQPAQGLTCAVRPANGRWAVGGRPTRSVCADDGRVPSGRHSGYTLASRRRNNLQSATAVSPAVRTFVRVNVDGEHRQDQQ